MPRVVCVIQARLGSTRFPRKVLAELCGKPVLQHVIERAKEIDGVALVVVSTPASDAADLYPLTESCRVPLSIGPDTDLLKRYAIAARLTNADAVIRVTGDCPLLDPRIADEVLRRFRDIDGATSSQLTGIYVSNDTRVTGFADGHDVEVFNVEGLMQADRKATDPEDREHVGPWLRRHCLCGIFYAPEPWTGPKLSIDTPEDLEVCRRWMETHQ